MFRDTPRSRETTSTEGAEGRRDRRDALGLLLVRGYAPLAA
jgi:hypothetical protein